MLKDKLKNKTVPNKIKFLYRNLELLRLEHNEEGRKAREGEITMEQFRTYQKEDFGIRQKKVLVEIGKIKDTEDMFRPNRKGKEQKNIPRNNKFSEGQQLKEEGKLDTTWDVEIDIINI